MCTLKFAVQREWEIVLMEKQIRVLLVEDEAIVCEAICALLANEERITVVGKAMSAEAAVRKAHLLKPDVILLDLQLPDGSGVEVTQAIMAENPDACIVILTGCVDEGMMAAAFKSGAVGYVLKTQDITELVRAIENARQGQMSLHPKVAHMMVNKVGHSLRQYADEIALSEAEMRVLSFVAQGLANKEIAHRLGVSRMTVHVHVSSILSKLRLTNRTQAVLYALKRGWVTLDESPKSLRSKQGVHVSALSHPQWGRKMSVRAV
jgi:DNA-binding NarL/FixJ family response regulator